MLANVGMPEPTQEGGGGEESVRKVNIILKPSFFHMRNASFDVTLTILPFDAKKVYVASLQPQSLCEIRLSMF